MARKPTPTNETTKETANEVAKTENKSTAVTTYDDVFSAHAGAGLENVTSADLIIPRLAILQALSPQVKQSKPEFIDGAREGDICDVGTSELFDAPLIFLPVHYVKQWLEWAPRASGKGLVKIHNDNAILDRCKQDDKGRWHTPDGNLIQETAQFFGLNISAGGRWSFLPLASTQLKKSKKWLTLSTSEKLTRPDGSEFTPPLFYRTYNLSAAEESNAEGEWFGWKIERGERLQDLPNFQALYKSAIEFRESIQKGLVRGELADAGDTEDAKPSSGDDRRM